MKTRVPVSQCPKSKNKENLIMKTTIYVRGYRPRNSGLGCYAAIIFTVNGSYHLTGVLGGTTTPRMTLCSAIEALKSLKSISEVTIYSDFDYLINAFNKGWLSNWKLKNWRGSDNKPIANQDLWKELDQLINKHSVTFERIKDPYDDNYQVVCRLASEACYHEACHPDEADYVI